MVRPIRFAIVRGGEIDMSPDDGDARLWAGEAVIQCGTIRARADRYDGLCRIAFVLIDAIDENGNKRP